MKKIDVAQTIAIIANLGVIAGLVFLAYELRQNTLATEIAAADNYIASIHESNNTIIANPHLVALLANVTDSELGAEDALMLRIVHANALRNWQRAFYLYSQGALDESLWRTQAREMPGTMAIDARLYDFWMENRDRYDPGFNAMLDGLLEASAD